MKLLALIGLLVSILAGCGGGGQTSESTTSSPATSASTESPAASGCTASGLDAMTTLSNFELEMNDAQKAGKLTVDQLIAARNKLFDQTQAAADANDWAAYCKAIDDTRTELGL